ncbi:MAG: hypothetical protein ABL966_11160, partial [Acidimicrobiales bacterium]
AALSTAAEEILEVRLPGGAEVAVRLAIGVAAYPEHASDADGIYMAADAALAEAVETNAPLRVAI